MQAGGMAGVAVRAGLRVGEAVRAGGGAGVAVLRLLRWSNKKDRGAKVRLLEWGVGAAPRWSHGIKDENGRKRSKNS